MPFESKRQARFMFANKDKLAKQGVDVNEWAASTDFAKLPETAPGVQKKPHVKKFNYAPKSRAGYTKQDRIA